MNGKDHEPVEPSELTADGLAALGAGNACDREPIHLPGAVQPHGFLLAIDPATGVVEVASDNVAGFLDATADEILGRPVAQVLGPRIAEVITAAAGRDLLDPEVVTVALPTAPPDRRRQDLTLHRSDGLLV